MCADSDSNNSIIPAKEQEDFLSSWERACSLEDEFDYRNSSDIVAELGFSIRGYP